MRKRKRHVNVWYMWFTVAALTAISYISAFIEVSYYLNANKRSTKLYEQFITSTVPENNGKENRKDLQHCQEALQLAVVCAGVQWSVPISTLLKSILRYRQQALVLHFIVDDVAWKILSLLFATWQLPAVKVIFYNTSLYIDRVSWIPNRHYSGKYGFMKLILDDILPNHVEKVIALDMDVLLMDDIGQLWSFFKKLSTLQAMGLVENLSNWYLFNETILHRRTWPAWERGFNSGVMLLDLTKLRSMNWTHIWRTIASEGIQKFGPTELADQDIINAVISRYPWIVQKLPCEWNFQLGFQSRQNLCLVKISHLKLVHWNSPLKTKTFNRYAVFFRRYYEEMQNLDGNLFKSSRIHCYDNSESSSLDNFYEYDDNDDGCGEIRHARWIIYRTQLYIRPYNFTAAPTDVVLVTQFSMDRLINFNTLLHFWTGPISAAVYVSDSELSILNQYFDDMIILTNRTNIALHAVYKKGTYYPINYLRNVALNSSNDTSFVFLVDIDFVPKPGLYTLLCQKLAVTDPTSKIAFVIPAFEYIGKGFPIIPRTKTEMLAEIDAGRMQIFLQDIWNQGHAATNYDRWRSSDQEYSVSWQMDYEPYIVVRRNEVLHYDQRFVGFGWNKVSHTMSLNAAGFQFVVLPDAFIVHQPHLPSFEMSHYRSLAVYRKCLKALKGEFVRDLIREQNKKQKFNYSAN